MKRQKAIPGSIVKIEIEVGYHVYGRILNHGDVAIYDCKVKDDIKDLNIIINSPIMFKSLVGHSAIIAGKWPIIGHVALDESLMNSKYWTPEAGHPNLCKISENGVYRYMVDKSEAEGLYDGAIRSAESMEQRIRDFYAGNSNESVEWVKSLR